LAGLCWLKENLRNTKYADGSEIPFAQPYYHAQYPDVAQNESDFGLLYDWYSAAKVTRSVQGICPNGWRLPTSEELASLNLYAVETLKDPDFWLQPNSNTNSAGMESRGAGYYNSNIKRFEDLYGYTAYWSADAPTETSCLAARLTCYCNQIEIVPIKLTNAISVRCVME